jgi:hypothetical protein
MAQFQKEMLAKSTEIDNWAAHVGQGAPRVILSFDAQTPNVSFGDGNRHQRY